MNPLEIVRNEFLHLLGEDHIAVNAAGVPIARATTREAVEQAAPNAAAYFSGAEIAAAAPEPSAQWTNFPNLILASIAVGAGGPGAYVKPADEAPLDTLGAKLAEKYGSAPAEGVQATPTGPVEGVQVDTTAGNIDPQPAVAGEGGADDPFDLGIDETPEPPKAA